MRLLHQLRLTQLTFHFILFLVSHSLSLLAALQSVLACLTPPSVSLAIWSVMGRASFLHLSAPLLALFAQQDVTFVLNKFLQNT